VTYVIGVLWLVAAAAHAAFPGGDLPGPDPVRQWRPLRFGPCRQKPARVPTGSVPGKGIAVKAAIGAAGPAQEIPMTHNPVTFLLPDTEADDAQHALSPSAHLLDELALYGHRPGQDEPDPRPLPDADAVRAEFGAIVDSFATMLTNTRLEDDLDDLLWSFVNVFHRKIDRVRRELDSNEQAQRRSQLEQDGSEIRSVELEQLTAHGISLIERRNAFEFCREAAAECYEAVTGSAWRPRSGSMVNHRALTSAVIDSREFIAAKRRAETQLLIPVGTRIAFTGGTECNDHQRIWAALDRVHAKHADMVLLHGGSPRGAERIAACWADNRKIAQIVFKPDWNRHRNAAPFQAQRCDA